MGSRAWREGGSAAATLRDGCVGKRSCSDWLGNLPNKASEPAPTTDAHRLEHSTDTSAPMLQRVRAEAVFHTRAAARLLPSRYGKLAAGLSGWEDAERLNKEAVRRERLDREAMVGAMSRMVMRRRVGRNFWVLVHGRAPA